jgi:Spy/CpxP family protein refolding chaperone
VLSQLARALEVSAETLYIQAGYLSDEKKINHTTEAIAKDTDLTEHQKSQLLDLYANFVISNQVKEEQS